MIMTLANAMLRPTWPMLDMSNTRGEPGLPVRNWSRTFARALCGILPCITVHRIPCASRI